MSDEKNISTNKQDKKRARRRAISGYDRHKVLCPHCNKEILDHFTECPFCHNALTPYGYTGDEKKSARNKRIAGYIGVAVAIAVVIVVLIVNLV